MKPLEPLWKETKEKFDKLESALIDCYIDFLREVARIYLEQGRRSEIRFEPELNEKIIEEYLEIKKENIEDIRYQI